MATAEECRRALEALAGRLSNLDPAARATHLADRSLSCTVSDLGVTFATTLSPEGAGPVTEVDPGGQRAHVRFSAHSDDLIAIAADPGQFGRAWLTGRVKVNASLSDLFRLRKLLLPAIRRRAVGGGRAPAAAAGHTGPMASVRPRPGSRLRPAGRAAAGA